MRARDELQFIRQWIRRPAEVGALIPSGRALATAMAGEVDVESGGTIVELGPGTGCVTRALLEAGLPPANLIAIERNDSFFSLLHQRFPDIRIVRGEAQTLASLLQEAGAGPVAAVVSSLPLLSMPENVRQQVLNAIFDVLVADGILVQYTYGFVQPVPGELRAALNISGERTNRVLANLPPATVWRYQRA